MSYKHLISVVLLILLSFSMSIGLAQEEETTEQATEATEPVVETTEESPEATEPAPAVTEENENEAESGVYIVVAGDNLFRIALRYGLTTQELAEANGISNPSLIYVGQRIVIPGEAAPPAATETASPEAPPTATEAPPPSGSTYVVQPGDTLFRIALRNNTTVNSLLNINPQISNPNLIFVGQSINLPDGSEPVTVNDSSADTDSGSNLNVSVAPGVEVFLVEGEEVGALVSQATQLGVQWVKITVSWAEIEPEQGSIEFDQLDEAVDAFDSAGFDIMLTLTDAPDWSRPSSTALALQQPTYGPPDDLTDFGNFAGTVAEHYAGIVDAYEIWHQPNNRRSWMTPVVELRSDGFPDAHLADVRYIDLLEVASTAIRAADPDAMIITAGLAPSGIHDFYNSIDNFVFFEELLTQGALDYADAMGVHLDGFSNAPDAVCCAESSGGSDPQFDISYHFFFKDSLENYRTILDRNGGSDIPLWVTRVGWGTADDVSGTPPPEMRFVTLNSADEQGEYVAAAFEAANERGDIGPMIFYNLNGCATGQSEACYYSAIGESGSARPVFSLISSLDLSGN